MPDFADFARLHPNIEMEILLSGELANLTSREADVAIRVVYGRKTLPLNLHGLEGPELYGGVYISRDRLAGWRAGALGPVRWIVIGIIEFRIGPSRARFAPRGFHSGPLTQRRRSSLHGRSLDHDAAALHRRCRPLLVRSRTLTCTCTERSGSSHRGRHARRSACGCSRSSYRTGSPVRTASRRPVHIERLTAEAAGDLCRRANGP
jgi:hypothetical protein